MVKFESQKINIKTFEKYIGPNQLSFGKLDLLMEIRGVSSGSVSPFDVINDIQSGSLSSFVKS